MELLFDTLMKGNSFGGIMAIEEEEGNKPLFAYRHFTKNGENLSSIYDSTNHKDHLFIIDGQQRLQSFYIGLMGSINGKILYFDLFSDYKNLEYGFKFEKDSTKLPEKATERESEDLLTHKWYPVNKLFKSLKETNDEDQIADEIIASTGVVSDIEKDHIRKNTNRFYRSVFNLDSIGISKVRINRQLNENSNRQRIVELFRRLNDGGTKLSAFDLVASILKGFDWKMEGFLDSVLRDHKDIGVTQEILIKLIFILKDIHNKEMTELEEQHASFAIDNQQRITKTLEAMKRFLKVAKLLEYYKDGNRSFIPLYFVAYYIFHKNDIETENLEYMFDTYDTTNKTFQKIYNWIYWSLLNGVFSRGSGWIPYKTGIRKILDVMKTHKNKEFPLQQLFSIYFNHPVNFYTALDSYKLSQLDSNFLYYILYNRESTTRKQDIDHIHAESILLGMGIASYKIHTIINYQLLDYGTNRGLKNAKPLNEWINNYVENKQLYLKEHLIPLDDTLWDPINYDQFYEERAKLLIDKIVSTIGIV
ncbi:hypothetical protein SD71_09715 [Cohnella kolymensis]|uniref:GmrSD restriction endonucleases N-terminal domain-containing protein n=2 Tax=Cohnella kolymensis TaxID=1590652 RepID=A0ABR5A5B4_9BACL|nr:hypothetical protein SD71_09715 [Cohnella kolymensis]